jgi:hypothetical protein
MVLTNILLAVLIIEIWLMGKLLYHGLSATGEEIEKITTFLIEIRNAVVKRKPGDSPH